MITRGCVSYLHIYANLKGFLLSSIFCYVIDFFLVNVWYVNHAFLHCLFHTCIMLGPLVQRTSMLL